MRDVVVIGAGMHRYGVFPDKSISALGTEAIRNALKDANMKWEDIETAYCGTIQPGLSTGHRICNEMGFSGLGITNVENASASGSVAFREAYLSVASGENDVALAFGVDKMIVTPWSQKPDKTKEEKKEEEDKNESDPPRLLPVHFFAALAQQHMKDYGTTPEQLGQVSVKSHYNASLNPYAHFQKATTIKEVNSARIIADPLTVLHCCPVDEGAAAVIVCSKDMAKKYTEKVCPSVVTSVLKSMLPDGDLTDLTRVSAQVAYERAGVEPVDLDLIELHDAFTIEEILYCEALGLCEEGEGGRMVEKGTTAINGKHPINTSGGLISMGHPIGPTGVGQIAEILWQMRGECGKRQIKKPVKLTMAHMVGAGGVCVIHLFQR